MAREWYNKPINYYNNDQTKPYTVVVGVTTGNYNNGNPDTYVKTWMEYYKIPHTDADKLANQSRVDVKLYSQVIDGGSASGMSIWTSAENFGYAGWDGANRSSYSCTFDFNDKNCNKFFDGILAIPHLADGTKTITLQAGFSTNNHTSAITGGSVSGSVTLDAIETFKPTTIYSVSGCYYGYPTTISLDRKASNLRELVTITNGSKTFTIKETSGTGSDATTINWTMPYEDGGVVLVPNTAYPSQSTWTLSVTTYNGSTQVGSPVTQTLTFFIRGDDTSFAPTLTAQPVVEAVNTGVNAFLGTDTAVYNISGINVKAPKANVSLKYGATIQSRYVRFSGETIFADQTDHITERLLNGENGWEYVVVDSRGFQVSVSGSMFVYTYSRPSMDSVSVFRGDENGNPSSSGTYIYATATPKIDALNNKNELVSFTGKVGSGSAQNMTSGVRKTLMSNASTASSYVVTLAVTDKISTTTLTVNILSVDTPFAVRKNGYGVGIGYSTTNTGLQVGYETTFHDDVYLEDDDDASARAWIRPDFFACAKNYTSGSNTYKNSIQVFAGSLTSLIGTKVVSEIYDINDVMWNKFEAEYHSDHLQILRKDGNNSIIKTARLANDALVLADINRGANVDSNTRITPTDWKLDGRHFATCNLIDQALLEQGGIDFNNGSEQALTMRLRSGFTPIKASTTYTLKFSTTNNLRIRAIVYYNANKGWVSTSQYGTDATEATFTTPSGVSYLRIVLQNASSGTVVPSEVYNVQLEKGSSASSYAPYTMDGVEVAERCRTWKDLGQWTSNLTIPSYATEILIMPLINGNWRMPHKHFLVQNIHSTYNLLCDTEGTNYYSQTFTWNSGTKTLTLGTTTLGGNWSQVKFYVYAK